MYLHTEIRRLRSQLYKPTVDRQRDGRTHSLTDNIISTRRHFSRIPTTAFQLVLGMSLYGGVQVNKFEHVWGSQGWGMGPCMVWVGGRAGAMGGHRWTCSNFFTWAPLLWTDRATDKHD